MKRGWGLRIKPEGVLNLFCLRLPWAKHQGHETNYSYHLSPNLTIYIDNEKCQRQLHFKKAPHALMSCRKNGKKAQFKLEVSTSSRQLGDTKLKVMRC